MKPQTKKIRRFGPVAKNRLVYFLFAAIFAFVPSCAELEKPKTEKFFSQTKPPVTQEFRWTNGKLPKSFDPAKASAPPETDFARALYEGLTDTEPKTLKPIPGVAAEWSASEDNRTWTFKLRKDAKWTNGKSVTANDFVRSWKRLAVMGYDVPQHELLKNIVGMRLNQEMHVHKDTDVFSRPTSKKLKKEKGVGKSPVKSPTVKTTAPPKETNQPKPVDPVKKELSKEETREKTANEPKMAAELGVTAVNDFELRVSLVQPDSEFPMLAAHPVFRPVYSNGEEFEKNTLNPEIVSNGAFRVASVDDQGVALKRAETYWAKDEVKLERVRFVPAKDGESALQAYREGRVDAVTNAGLQPLALKLLDPFFDFRRVTHSALNFYEFNRQKAPFNDRRVRQALAIAIERKRLTEDEMDGATKPANRYLPFGKENTEAKLELDTAKARDLLKKAGFENGADFPKIRLVINRNNIQQRIAKSVAKMWKKELNVETEIIVKELAELETAKRDRDYDLLRRGVVLPTSDETANMLAIFKPTRLTLKEAESKSKLDSAGNGQKKKKPSADLASNANSKTENGSTAGDSRVGRDYELRESDELLIDVGEDKYILTEEQALIEVPAIPLYFPTSYSLIKPYVKGFEINTLDAPLLKRVEIDSSWQPKNAKSES